MNAAFFAYQLLVLALVLMSLATVSEFAATLQVASERYRYVPLIRLLRKGHKAAACLVAAVAGLAIWTMPGAYLPVLALAVSLGCLIQLLPLFSGYRWEEVVLYGVTPVTAVLVPLYAYLSSELPNRSDFHLGVPALEVAVIIAVQCFIIRHYRKHRDLLLILQ